MPGVRRSRLGYNIHMLEGQAAGDESAPTGGLQTGDNLGVFKRVTKTRVFVTVLLLAQCLISFSHNAQGLTLDNIFYIPKIPLSGRL